MCIYVALLLAAVSTNGDEHNAPHDQQQIDAKSGRTQARMHAQHSMAFGRKSGLKNICDNDKGLSNVKAIYACPRGWEGILFVVVRRRVPGSVAASLVAEDRNTRQNKLLWQEGFR